MLPDPESLVPRSWPPGLDHSDLAGVTPALLRLRRTVIEHHDGLLLGWVGLRAEYEAADRRDRGRLRRKLDGAEEKIRRLLAGPLAALATEAGAERDQIRAAWSPGAASAAQVRREADAITAASMPLEDPDANPGFGHKF